MSKIKKDDDFDALYQENLRKLESGKVRSVEPRNGGTSLASFFESVTDLGDKIKKNGTIINRFRT